jgi:thioredoxin-related protein
MACLVALLVSVGTAGAQDVRWRTDFAAARKEAAASGKPMLLDFGTEACMWCRKMDATTLRDRAVVDAINARFIAVKVDGERDERLTQAVGVQAFPTLAIVSAEGKVVAKHEGYADVPKMMSILRQAPAAAPVKEQARPAPAPLARTAAGDLLLAARTDHDAGRYLECLHKCDRLQTSFANSTEAAEGRRLSSGVTADPEKWKLVTAQLESNFSTVKKDLDAALKR